MTPHLQLAIGLPGRTPPEMFDQPFGPFTDPDDAKTPQSF